MRKPFARTLVAGCVHCGCQQACAAARWRVYGAGVGTARRASELLALAAPQTNPRKRLRSTSARALAPSAAARDRGEARTRPRLGNRGSLPSNAVAHVACWRCVPVVPGRGGKCAMPAAHLARRMQQQLPSRARELSPRVAVAGCLSPCKRDRAACGVTEGGLPPFGTLRAPWGTSTAHALRRSGEAAACESGCVPCSRRACSATTLLPY